jgi:hypothetical protein
LNPHAFRRHPLKMVSLPIPPLPHFVNCLESILIGAFARGRFPLHRILHPPRKIHACFGPLQSADAHKQLPDRLFARVHVAHVGLNVIVSGYVLQRERVRVLSGRGQESVATMPNVLYPCPRPEPLMIRHSLP